MHATASLHLNDSRHLTGGNPGVVHRAAKKTMHSSHHHKTAVAAHNGQATWTDSNEIKSFERAKDTLSRRYASLMILSDGVTGSLVQPLRRALTDLAHETVTYCLLGDVQVRTFKRNAQGHATATAIFGAQAIDVYAVASEHALLGELHDAFGFTPSGIRMPPTIVHLSRNIMRPDDVWLIDTLYDRYVRTTPRLEFRALS